MRSSERTGRRAPISRLPAAHCSLPICSLLPRCRVDMQDQPKMKPYRSSPFYKDVVVVKTAGAGHGAAWLAARR